MPPTDELPRLSEAYMQNSRWMLDHANDIARDHPNQWVAVYGGKVVASDPELGVVSRAAAKIAPPEDTVVEFIDDGNMIFTVAGL